MQMRRLCCIFTDHIPAPSGTAGPKILFILENIKTIIFQTQILLEHYGIMVRT